MKQAVIRLEAQNDLKDAFAWYEEKRPGLGHDFLLQIEAGIRFIERNPEINPPGYQGTRKHFTRRFPYKIIYLVEKERIVVLAVIHGRRSPDLTRTRIDNI